MATSRRRSVQQKRKSTSAKLANPEPNRKTAQLTERASSSDVSSVTREAAKSERERESAGRSGRKADKKSKRDKVIRDSFTMPVAEYDQIALLKRRCVGLGTPMKKSELLRAGIGTLQQMSDDRLAQTIAAVINVKTGRPPGEKKKKKEKEKGKDNRTRQKAQ